MKLLPGQRVDWQRVLLDLRGQSVGHRRLSVLLQVPKSTIDGWANGAEPRHADGERLVVAWCSILQRDRSELPVTVVQLSAAKVIRSAA